MARHRTFRTRLAKRLYKWARRLDADLGRPPSISDRHCPICDFRGRFLPGGETVQRADCRCPSCGSNERDRLLKLTLDDRGFRDLGDLVDFGPRATGAAILSPLAKRYRGADVRPGAAELTLDVERIDLESNSIDTIFCSHVLEHVDDRKALSEFYRVLRAGGRAILLTPVAFGMPETYENASITDPQDRLAHFGQKDHTRVFGRDIEARIREPGFVLECVTAPGAACVAHGLIFGDTVFLARKPV